MEENATKFTTSDSGEEFMDASMLIREYFVHFTAQHMQLDLCKKFKMCSTMQEKLVKFTTSQSSNQL